VPPPTRQAQGLAPSSDELPVSNGHQEFAAQGEKQLYLGMPAGLLIMRKLTTDYGRGMATIWPEATASLNLARNGIKIRLDSRYFS
jgi:hypothetical protein